MVDWITGRYDVKGNGLVLMVNNGRNRLGKSTQLEKKFNVHCIKQR